MVWIATQGQVNNRSLLNALTHCRKYLVKYFSSILSKVPATLLTSPSPLMAENSVHVHRPLECHVLKHYQIESEKKIDLINDLALMNAHQCA